MKRWLKIALTFVLAAETLELVWRRLAWHQSPPELPLWLWAVLLGLNSVALGIGFRGLLIARKTHG